MTKTTRSTVVMGTVLGLLVGGCGLGVLSRTPNPDAAPYHDSGPPPLIACDPANLPKASCAQTCLDAQTILQTFCGTCHESENIGGLGTVSDYHSLSNVQASSKFPGWVYVRPGDPDHSLIYKRVAIDGDMPPPSTIDVPIPHPSVSDISVLREWIQGCIPDVPGRDAGPPPSVDAGTDGARPYTYATCPTVPPTGACSVQEMVCPYPTQTCTCDGTTWNCQSCPAEQPAYGATCPTAPGSASTVVSFGCAYGNVTCNCVATSPFPINPRAWACGVCPATAPISGQACGNTTISCPYDQQQCDCIAGTWLCQLPACNSSELSLTPRRCSGFYSCDFSTIDQACTCSGTAANEAVLACSCPAAAPKSGSLCESTSAPCVYSDQSCSCAYAGWQCTQRCPDARPADGSTCASSLNCSYGGGLCYCDGAAWHCS